MGNLYFTVDTMECPHRTKIFHCITANSARGSKEGKKKKRLAMPKAYPRVKIKCYLALTKAE